MKRRVISLIVALTLCLNLCPVWAFAAVAETAGGLCPHHPEHTEECGYDPENPDASCTFACPVCSSGGSVLSEASGGPEDPEGEASAPADEEDSAEPGEAPGDSVLPTVPDEPEKEASAPAGEEDSAEPGEAPGDSVLPTVPGEPEDSEGDASTPEDGEDPASPGEAPGDDSSGNPYSLTENRTYSNPLEISYYSEFKTNEFTFTGTGSSALLVTGTGKLHLTGTIAAPNGVGVKVESGGVLYVTGTDTVIRSDKSYGLELDSGATAHLTGGTFIGKGAAIQAEDFARLLEPGYAYFDSNGNLVSPADAKTIKILTVGQCSNHGGNKGYTHDSGATTHSWTCPYCAQPETENCTFTFKQDGTGACQVCGGTITITVNQSALGNLIYDGTKKPGVITTTVDLNDGSGKVLTKDTDYTVHYEPRKDAGEVEVTVTGITFNGTFTKTYEVEQAQPGISWDATTKAVDYDGRPVDELPNVTITIPASEDLHPYLQYAYRKTGKTAFTDGLPTNAGEYEVKAYLPESQNYKRAETETLLTLTIQKISPVADAPAAKTLTYNREVQELVTAGSLKPLAAADGAKILFATSQGEPYSETIPTGLNANTYEVWYKVEKTDNCEPVEPTQIAGVKIDRKHITPVVTLSTYTYLYDGGYKQPTVTVKDDDRVTDLLDTEYKVAYSNNRNVSTEANPALVTVTDADPDGGNYDLNEVKVEFKITSKTQETLTIVDRPNTVIYGDKFTLSTSGGSGSGDVTWEITEGKDAVATIGSKSGQVTIVGDGEFTVKATKSGKDPDATHDGNYEPATATWTVTADKKPVVATVTAEDKTYGETYDTTDLKEAKVKAVVEQGVLAGDVITITGLTGTFDDEHAGQDKTVTVVTSGASITGTNFGHYAVSYSSLTVKATIHKAIAHITTAPGAANPTYNGTPQALITAATVDISGVSAEYSLSKDGPYTTAFPKGTNAGKYTVWYRIQETGDYTGEAPQSMEAEIQKKLVAPTITLSGDGMTEETDGHCSYIYDGKAKEPAVTLTEADGTLIPAGEYTVGYGNNVNVSTAATVTATAKADGNYTFTNAPVTATFEIKEEQAKVLTAPVEADNPLTFNNRAQKLVTAGTASGGTMVYWVDDGVTDVADATFLEQIPTKLDAGDYKVYYMVAGDGNHSDSAVGNLTVTIAPKTVKDPTIELKNSDGTTLVNYTYDGTAKTPTVIVKDGSTVIGTTDLSGENDEYNVTCSNNTDAGTATVSISAKPGGNYTVTGSTTFVIQKADIVDPNPTDANVNYNGKPQELLELNVTGSIGGEIQFALGSPNSAFAPAIPKETNAGTYTVYYRVVGDKNHNDLVVRSVTATISRKPLSAITIELSPESFVYDGGVKMPAIAVKDERVILPEEEYTVTCTDASGTVTTAPTNEGIYTITITDAANGNYDLGGVADNEVTFTIDKTAQAELAIDHSGVTSTNYGDTFQLTTTGGTGNGAVTWESTDNNIATVDAFGNVTITGVGEVTITAKKAADTNYEETQAQWTFTAAPKPVTADVTVSSKAYDSNTDAAVTSASITTVNGSDNVTIDPASIKAAFETASVGTGKTVTLDTSKVKVTGDDADKYAISYPATTTADITQETTNITKAPAEITGLTYDGQPQALITAGETNVGFLVYSLDGTNFSKEIPTGTNAGTYTVHYKVDATGDYTGEAGGTVSVDIDPKSITPKIELSETSYVYDGSKKEPKITVKDDKTVIDDDQYTITWEDKDSKTVTELKNVGTYTATIESAANGNYTFVDSENNPQAATATVEIVAASQGSLKITGKPSHVYYGDTITTLDTAGGAGNGTVKWTILDGNDAAPINSTINLTSGVLEIKDVGTFTVTAERTVDNYATVTDTWTFTVEPKPVTAVVTVADKTYDDSDTATVTNVEVKSSDKVNSGDTITIDFTNVVATFDNANVGTNKAVTIDSSKASVTAGADKYAVSYPATVTASITAKSLTTVTVTLSDHDLKTDTTVTPNKYYYIFNGSERKPNAAAIGTADGKTFTLTASDYTVEYSKNQNAGTAAVTVKAAAGGNYTFDDVKVEFEIRNGSAALVRSPQAQDLTYNGTAQDLVTVGEATGGKVVYLLAQDGVDTTDVDSYLETIPQETKAGTYTVYYMVKGDANHSDTAPSQLSVTIKPKTITPVITLTEGGSSVTAGTYTYDGNAKEPTVTVQDGSGTITVSEYTVSYRDNTNAGTATVTISDNNGGNYTVNGTATFEIAKAASVFTTTPAAIDGLQYNGSAQVLVKAGGSNDGTVLYSVNGGNYTATIPTGTAVDTYAVSYKIQGDANHADTAPVTLNVEIAKNTVTNPVISLSSDQFTFNGGQQKPTIEVYDNGGNLIPKNEYSATIAPTTGGDVGIVSVGTYTVTITPTDKSNYDIQGTSTKTFEIVPANQETISITGTKAQVRYGETIQLGITGGTGTGTITWKVTGGDGKSVSSTVSATGLLTVKDVGVPIKVTVERTADNHNTVTASWEFSAAKKQVTAVVTADDRPYDASSKTVDVTAVVPDSELVDGDSINITGGVTGTMDDPNVGTNKKVKVDGSNASVTGTNAENYEITYPATTTVNITAEAATVDSDPDAVSGLTYDAGKSQELVTAGTATGGILVYSLDGANFTPAIPKAKGADAYTVYFKAQGDGNHTDSAVGTVPVTIGQQTVTPTVELSPSTAKYDGGEHKPTTVTLRDGDKNVIPTSEYDVTYDTTGGKNWTDQGTYTVKITNRSGGNYTVEDATATFTISATAQNPLEITNKPGLVYYGDTFTLSAVGGSGSGAVTWKVDPADSSVAEVDANGTVRIKGTGQAKIIATRPGGTNYDDATAEYSFNALPKPVTATVTADDREYVSGDTSAAIHVTWNGLVGTDTIDTSNLVGTFVDENVGQNKTVNITGTPVDDATAKKYDITIPATTTASITKADVTAPTLTANTLEYTGSAQALVSGGNANTTVYSDTRDGVYSANVPTGTNAGTYTVWYKEQGDANHNDSAPQAVTVTISRKELENPVITLSGNDLKVDSQEDGSKKYSYVYDGSDKRPTVTIMDGAAAVPANEYTVSYENNKNVSTSTVKGTVKITSNDGGNYTFAEQTVTFEITGAGAQLTSSPQAKDLTYTGQAQELVTVGTTSGGHIEYSKDGATYSKTIPTETVAGTYTVTYKVVADDNYTDGTETWTVSVTIKPKTIVSPKVTVSGTYTYDGNPQVPAGGAITVMDGTTTIPDTEYTVDFRDNVKAGWATVIITNANGGNYIVNGTGTFKIEEAAASVEKAPDGNNLPYNGSAQALVTAGTASGGIMVYSLTETGEYSPVIPTATAVDNYTVWYKVQGDDNHSDSEPQSVTASIKVNEVENLTVQVTPEAATYTGKVQKPTVTVMDGSHVIDGSEYTVTYADTEGNTVTDLTEVGTYTLTITGSGTHYTFTKTANFEILPADQTPLTITGQREHVYYGDKLLLNTTGGSGTVTWDVGGSGIASIDEDSGLLKISGVGSVTVTATSKDSNYADQTVTWSFLAEAKPVTAVVTAASKNYDSKADADVTATLQSSDLVNGDTITIKLPGSVFEDANAGTNKRVIVNSSNPAAITDSNGTFANYSITYPATATASIFKVDIESTNITVPTAVSGLEYDGTAKDLVAAGSVANGEGTMEYSTDGFTYSVSLPTGTNAKSYDVWYRVKGDGNHNDTAGTKLAAQVTIKPQEVKNPIIEFKPSGVPYDGMEHKPDVIVKDTNGNTIPNSEYTVTYGSTDWKTAGDHTVTIENKADKTNGNYSITTATKNFTISMMGQNPLAITNQPGKVQYGDSFTLSTTGGSGTGEVTWSVTVGGDIAHIDGNGLVTLYKAGGPVTVKATKAADSGYASSEATWTFNVAKKPVKTIVTAKDKEFDGEPNAELVITWKDGDLVGNDEIVLVLDGKFTNSSAGENKTVNITGNKPDSDKYDISWNTTTTASITPKTATVNGVTAKTNLVYNGQPQVLVNAGNTDSGNVVYSLDSGATYLLDPPSATNAGTYTVWYKAESGSNYEDSAAKAVSVTIKPKEVTSPVIELSPNTFNYDGNPKKPDVVVKDGTTLIPASEYAVSYSDNVAASDNAKVMINDNPGGNYTVSGTATFTIESGAATLTQAPQERELTYTGNPQALVTAGSAVNGRVVYSDDDGVTYNTTIPKRTDAGTYEVWYKVKGNDGYADTDPDYVTVTINPKQVTPNITVTGSYQYTGSAVTPNVIVIVDGKQLTKDTDYTVVSSSAGPGPVRATVMSLGNNYQFTAIVTFEITKPKAEFPFAPKEHDEKLVYTGEAQELFEDLGFTNDGIVVCSVNGGPFVGGMPEGTEVGTYYVSVKVQGDATHEDSDVKMYRVTIGKNTIADDNLSVTLSPGPYKYTGSEIKPTVTVRDTKNNVTIPASEYSVTYSKNIDVGQADVTITSTTKNYSFGKTVHFTITDGDAPELTITGLPDAVYYGDTLRLSATGASGAVTWSIQYGSNAATPGTNGRFEITKPGEITITATAGSASKTVNLYADPKPVTATVIPADKSFDNNTNVLSWTVIVNDLVNGDTISSDDITVTGQFAGADVGTQNVYIAKLTPSDAVSARYKISYPATATAKITPALASVATPPAKAALSPYNGSAQPLVTAGTATDGTMMYSLDGTNYSYDIPTGTDAKPYTVWYKAVAADKNHEDSAVGTVTNIVISPNTDTPTVICTPNSFKFDGTEKAPTSVVVRDSNQHTIPTSEYILDMAPKTAVGEHEITVTDKPGGNYEFNTQVKGTFKIETGSQSNLTIVTELYDVYYGDSFRLSATGGSGDGVIVWSIPASGKDIATISANGVVKVTGTGGFTVEAYREASGGYGQSNTVSLPFEAHAKPVTPIVTVADKPYDSKTDATLTAKFRDGDLVGTDNLTLTAEGVFTTADAGTGKQVDITKHEVNGTNADKYDIRWPDSVTGSIYKVDAKLQTVPAAANLTYNKNPQTLLTPGSTVNNIGAIVYSTSQNGTYSTAIPTGTNAGTYSVWYKVADSVNYTGVAPAEIQVEIKKAEPTVTSKPTAAGKPGDKLSDIRLEGGATDTTGGRFTWVNGSTQDVNGTAYDVIFTPDDTTNYAPVTIQVTVTVTEQSPANPPSGEMDTPNPSDVTNSETNIPNAAETNTPSNWTDGAFDDTPIQPAPVQNSPASTTVSAAEGSRLVREAAANRSRNVVIQSETTGNGTKAEASLLSATVSRLGSETDAALTVSSPIADVTIPNAALSTLSREGSTIRVMTEQKDQSVALTLAADGKTVNQVPGGVTLTVPVEDAGPGTVAVLVHDDGTRETVRKSIVEDGVMSIPLNGSATVEIVDNSKDFTDVPEGNWAADAVDFAVSHELFNGTSETTFSPGQTMSRGMLATVLYRLEGSPETDLNGLFSDVNDSSYYAESIAWATENGITGGYGDGRFGPDDSITREQFVVMLWRYAGSPKASSQALDFADADQVSGFAQEALCWAVENNILHGSGDGTLTPGGTATRAHAAQLLKNFMENT